MKLDKPGGGHGEATERPLLSFQGEVTVSRGRTYTARTTTLLYFALAGCYHSNHRMNIFSSQLRYENSTVNLTGWVKCTTVSSCGKSERTMVLSASASAVRHGSRPRETATYLRWEVCFLSSSEPSAKPRIRRWRHFIPR